MKHKYPLDFDIIATDKIFAPLKNEGWPIMCGFSNTRAGSMSDWQKEETRKMSEQRDNWLQYQIQLLGSLERFIGHVVNRFAILRTKYTGQWEDLVILMCSCLALHNIHNHQELVQTKIFEMDEDTYDNMITEHKHWLEEETVPILSAKEIERRQRQREAENEPGSLHKWTNEV